jgi:hypothetical protein
MAIMAWEAREARETCKKVQVEARETRDASK